MSGCDACLSPGRNMQHPRIGMRRGGLHPVVHDEEVGLDKEVLAPQAVNLARVRISGSEVGRNVVDVRREDMSLKSREILERCPISAVVVFLAEGVAVDDYRIVRDGLSKVIRIVRICVVVCVTRLGH